MLLLLITASPAAFVGGDDVGSRELIAATMAATILLSSAELVGLPKPV
jgi:hypothetical protein